VQGSGRQGKEINEISPLDEKNERVGTGKAEQMDGILNEQEGKNNEGRKAKLK
jgi:hypothetical protein